MATRTNTLRTQVRNEVKALGLTRSDVSISVDVHRVRIQAKHENVDLKKVQDAVGKYESYDRDEMTGEILSGGNTFVFVVDQNGRTRNW